MSLVDSIMLEVCNLLATVIAVSAVFFSSVVTFNFINSVPPSMSRLTNDDAVLDTDSSMSNTPVTLS